MSMSHFSNYFIQKTFNSKLYFWLLLFDVLEK